MSASMASVPVPSSSRSRDQSRKKPSNDDSAYFGPLSSASSTTAKRHAIEKADSEPRIKRKRIDPISSASANFKKDPLSEPDQRPSLVEFDKMPTDVLYRYLTQFDAIPSLYPSPLSSENPPTPSSIRTPFRHSSRGPSPPPMTPANRPRRDPKELNRRRSSRLLEEEPRKRIPILADLDDLHGVLAGIVEGHFRNLAPISGRDEVDTLASFMFAIEKSKGIKLK